MLEADTEGHQGHQEQGKEEMIKLSELKSFRVKEGSPFSILTEFVEAWLLKEEAFKAAVTADMAFEDSASGPPSETRRLHDESQKRIAELQEAEKRFDAAVKKVSL